MKSSAAFVLLHVAFQQVVGLDCSPSLVIVDTVRLGRVINPIAGNVTRSNTFLSYIQQFAFSKDGDEILTRGAAQSGQLSTSVVRYTYEDLDWERTISVPGPGVTFIAERDGAVGYLVAQDASEVGVLPNYPTAQDSSPWRMDGSSRVWYIQPYPGSTRVAVAFGEYIEHYDTSTNNQVNPIRKNGLDNDGDVTSMAVWKDDDNGDEILIVGWANGRVRGYDTDRTNLNQLWSSRFSSNVQLEVVRGNGVNVLVVSDYCGAIVNPRNGAIIQSKDETGMCLFREDGTPQKIRSFSSATASFGQIIAAVSDRECYFYRWDTTQNRFVGIAIYRNGSTIVAAKFNSRVTDACGVPIPPTSAPTMSPTLHPTSPSASPTHSPTSSPTLTFFERGSDPTHNLFLPTKIMAARDACAIDTRYGRGFAKCWGTGIWKGYPSSGWLNVVGFNWPVVNAHGRSIKSLQQNYQGDVICATFTDGTGSCSGSQFRKSLGTGSSFPEQREFVKLFKPPSDSSTIEEFAVGPQHTCARQSDGQVVCVGHNDYGQCGSWRTKKLDTTSDIPVDLPTGAFATGIQAGRYYSCAQNDTKVYCWGSPGIPEDWLGYDESQLIGDGIDGISDNDPEPFNEMGDALRPVEVDEAEPNQVMRFSASLRHACAILNEIPGPVFCWGRDGSSRTTQFRSRGYKARQIETSDRLVCALLEDYTIMCWGLDGSSDGQLGDVGSDNKVRNLGGVAAVQVAAGDEFTCGLTVKHQVVCWGNERKLGIGLTTFESRSTNTVPIDFGLVGDEYLTMLGGLSLSPDPSFPDVFLDWHFSSNTLFTTTQGVSFSKSIVTRDEKFIFVGTRQGSLVKLDTQATLANAVVWEISLDSEPIFSSPVLMEIQNTPELGSFPTTNRTDVVVGTESGTVVRVNGDTGMVQWSAQVLGRVRTAVAIGFHDGDVYVTTDASWVYRINGANGAIVWQVDASTENISGKLSGCTLAFLDLQSNPSNSMGDQALVVSSNKGEIARLEIETGVVSWVWKDDGVTQDIVGPPRQSSTGTLIFGTTAGNLYSLVLDTGAMLRSEKAVTGGKPIRSSMTFHSLNDIIFTAGDEIISVSQSFFLRWRTSLGGISESSPFITIDGLVGVSDLSGTFTLLRQEDGAIVTQFNFGSPFRTGPQVIRDGKISLGFADNGAFVTLESCPLWPKQFSSSRPRLSFVGSDTCDCPYGSQTIQGTYPAQCSDCPTWHPEYASTRNFTMPELCGCPAGAELLNPDITNECSTCTIWDESYVESRREGTYLDCDCPDGAELISGTRQCSTLSPTQAPTSTPTLSKTSPPALSGFPTTSPTNAPTPPLVERVEFLAGVSIVGSLVFFSLAFLSRWGGKRCWLHIKEKFYKDLTFAAVSGTAADVKRVLYRAVYYRIIVPCLSLLEHERLLHVIFEAARAGSLEAADPILERNLVDLTDLDSGNNTVIMAAVANRSQLSLARNIPDVGVRRGCCGIGTKARLSLGNIDEVSLAPSQQSIAEEPDAAAPRAVSIEIPGVPVARNSKSDIALDVLEAQEIGAEEFEVDLPDLGARIGLIKQFIHVGVPIGICNKHGKEASVLAARNQQWRGSAELWMACFGQHNNYRLCLSDFASVNSILSADMKTLMDRLVSHVNFEELREFVRQLGLLGREVELLEYLESLNVNDQSLIRSGIANLDEVNAIDFSVIDPSNLLSILEVDPVSTNGREIMSTLSEWQSNHYDFFISHKQSNGGPHAEVIYLMLRDVTIGSTGRVPRVWLDVRMEGNLNSEMMKNGVQNSRYFVLFATDGYFKSQACRMELDHAIEHKKQIIVVFEGEAQHGGHRAGVSGLLKQVPKRYSFLKDIGWVPFYRREPHCIGTINSIIDQTKWNWDGEH